MSLEYFSKRELAIKDPQLHLNNYATQIHEVTKIEITKVCKAVKDDLGDSIPSYCFTKYMNDKFKNESQVMKAKLSHKDPETKEKQIESITNILKSNNKSLARRVLKAIKNDVKNDPSRTNRELASYINKRD